MFCNWAPSSEFVSSSIPSWQILTAHAQQFRGPRDLAFCLKVPLHSLLVWASSEGSGETARMRRLAWAFAARIDDKHQIHLTRSNYQTLLSLSLSLSLSLCFKRVLLTVTIDTLCSKNEVFLFFFFFFFLFNVFMYIRIYCTHDQMMWVECFFFFICLQ